MMSQPHHTHSLRLGLANCITSLAYLFGPPIAGSLVGIPDSANAFQAKWFKPIIFSGVCTISMLWSHHKLIDIT